MKLIILILCSFLLFIKVSGQAIDITHSSRDEKYVKDFYTQYLILRAYECTKFNNFKLIDGGDKLIYKPNRHNDLGIGFNYKILSLNIEFSVPFTEKNYNIYGVTHSFDVQTYIYIQHFVVDFYGQYYHGYYLSNAGEALTGYQPSEVDLRPDIRTIDMSLNVEYVFNDKKFSFNAPFFQNEIQEKSAGSFLVGGGIYYTNGKADSSFIPTLINNPGFFQSYRFNIFNYTAIGCNVGYAYTQVIKKQFFITGALSGGPGIEYAVIKYDQPDQKNGRIGVMYNASAKFAAGWTSDKYFVGVTYIRLITENGALAPHTWLEDNSGNFRFTVAQRFRLKKSLIPKSDIIKIE